MSSFADNNDESLAQHVPETADSANPVDVQMGSVVANSKSVALEVSEFSQSKRNEMVENGMEKVQEKEEDEAEEILFDESTHSLFIYFMDKKEKNWSALAVSLFVIVMQIGLYAVCLVEILNKLTGDDKDIIEVRVPYGRSCKNPDNLVCPPVVGQWHYASLAAILLGFFLMYDIFASIRIMLTADGKFAKFAALIILFEAVFAAVVASLFALQATSGYEAVANCIGVLFIHDVDEKTLEAFNVLRFSAKCKAKSCCSRKCCKLCDKTEIAPLAIVTFVLFCYVAVFGISIKQDDITDIQETYGIKFWNQRFGDDLEYDYGYGFAEEGYLYGQELFAETKEDLLATEQ